MARTAAFTVEVVAGRCCVPTCQVATTGAVVCMRCWWDLEPEERGAIRMAQESPFDRTGPLPAMEQRLALTAAALGLARRRQKGKARATPKATRIKERRTGHARRSC